MLALPELQRAFAAAILADETEQLGRIVQAGGIAPERRIQVYRNNSLITLGEALKATFPVVGLLESTFLWARKKPVEHRFQYFKQGLILRAAKLGIVVS